MIITMKNNNNIYNNNCDNDNNNVNYNNYDSKNISKFETNESNIF